MAWMLESLALVPGTVGSVQLSVSLAVRKANSASARPCRSLRVGGAHPPDHLAHEALAASGPLSKAAAELRD